MYFVPLSQPESIELVIHSLRAAGGEADCRQCPVYRVCTKQCLAVAAGVERMLKDGNLPQLDLAHPVTGSIPPEESPPTGGPSKGKGGLKVVK